MINAIKYYYDLYADNIKQIGNDYYFDSYVLKSYYKSLDINLYNYLVSNKIYLHQIIYNRDNEYITYINNKPYILLKIYKKNKIDLKFIENYNIIINYPNISRWSNLWSLKVDYYEKNADNIKDDIIKKSFNYYIGMAEEAILLYKRLNINNNLYLCHIRFKNNCDFYDPFNIVVDYKMRDYAEFIKKDFYTYNNYHHDFINKIIYNYNYNDVMLFFIRFLFPTTFFDQYDNYMKNEKIDYSFYNKRYEFEVYLKRIYKEIRKKYNVPLINWLQ